MYNHQLDTFIVVADCGSFSKAAETLYISVTAVIKQINLLEESINLKLFERTFRGVELTGAGTSLYRDAKYIIKYSKDSLIRAENVAQAQNNIIRIGTSIMTPSRFIVDLWSEIHKHCPELKFQLVSFENTPENAREILMNLGHNIDVVAGVFDEKFLKSRKCGALKIDDVKIYCAVSIQHRLAEKKILNIEDLFGERLMIINKGWNKKIDILREDIFNNFPQIVIEDFSFYSVEMFNQCETENAVIMTIEYWKSVHPLLKVIPVNWEYTIPFGLLHSPKPSKHVKQFLDTVKNIMNIK